MKTNVIIQLALMAAIVGLAGLIVQTTRQPQEAQSLGPEYEALKQTAETTQTAVLSPRDLKTTESAFGNLVASTVFKPIIELPPTPTPVTPRVTTPPPPPNPTLVIRSEGWRLSSVYKGQAEIERTAKKDWISLKVGDKVTVNYNRANLEIECISMDDKEQTIKLKLGPETCDLKVSF